MTGRSPNAYPGELPTAYRQLAARVIVRAIKDACRPHEASCQHSAEEFLADSPMLRYWCEIAGLDALRVARAARALMQRSSLAAHVAPTGRTRGAWRDRIRTGRGPEAAAAIPARRARHR